YESRLDPIAINTIQAWTLTIETANGNPVEGAQIRVDGDMPEHGHGLPTQPEATEYLGDGKYLIEGLKFSMPGWWVIKFNIASGSQQDIAVFNLLLKE
ncbi:MAG: FixH family protein, partial [Nitrospiraceae bacterium]